PEHRPDLDLTAVARPGIHMPQLHRPVKGSRLWARKDTRAWFGGLGHPPNLADLAPQVEHGHDLASLRQRWGMGGGWLSGDPTAGHRPVVAYWSHGLVARRDRAMTAAWAAAPGQPFAGRRAGPPDRPAPR